MINATSPVIIGKEDGTGPIIVSEHSSDAYPLTIAGGSAGHYTFLGGLLKTKGEVNPNSWSSTTPKEGYKFETVDKTSSTGYYETYLVIDDEE